MTGPEQHANTSGGDPDVVRSPDSLAESQARLNGPSGSPNSPPGRVPTWKALVEIVLRWGGPTWDPRSRQALDDLANLAAEADTLERERDEARRESDIQMGNKLAAQMTLKAVCDALDLPMVSLGNGWTEATPKILDRIGTIVDEAERGFAEREQALAEADRLREALAAYRSALRSGEPETEKLKLVGDAALAGPQTKEQT